MVNNCFVLSGRPGSAGSASKPLVHAHCTKGHQDDVMAVFGPIAASVGLMAFACWCSLFDTSAAKCTREIMCTSRNLLSMPTPQGLSDELKEVLSCLHRVQKRGILILGYCI